MLWDPATSLLTNEDRLFSEVCFFVSVSCFGADLAWRQTVLLDRETSPWDNVSAPYLRLFVGANKAFVF